MRKDKIDDEIIPVKESDFKEILCKWLSISMVKKDREAEYTSQSIMSSWFST